MKGYHKLNEQEIEELRRKLIKPHVTYPHYFPIKIDESKEDFLPIQITYHNKLVTLEISDYGRIKFNGKLVEQKVQGAFMHVAYVYSKDFGYHTVYELVKLAHDPIPDRIKYQIHHINNNALDNRIENLLYVTEQEHRSIDKEFNKELILISTKITLNNYNEMINYFSENSERSINQTELYEVFHNVQKEKIDWNINKLCNEKKILEITNESEITFRKYTLNENFGK